MEFVQERVTTLHDLADPVPDAPIERTSVVVPMSGRDCGRKVAERTFITLSRTNVSQVVVPLRVPEKDFASAHRWLSTFDVPLDVVWCNGRELESTLESCGINEDGGKGLDVWVGLGLAATNAEYVVVHDADAKDYSARHVARLCWPLANGFSFAKGYYARVERDRLYGRLFRLFVGPLIETLRREHDSPVIAYLNAFRYALSGECAMNADLARSIRAQPRWGLEVGVLGDAFVHAGFSGSAQVDLGVHRHEHRPVHGAGGLSEMATHVGRAVVRVIEENGIEPDYDSLPRRYREVALGYVRQYAADAAFNGFEHDPEAEREQVERYADVIDPVDHDSRLPAWSEVSLDATDVLEASRADLDRSRATGRIR